MKNVEIEEKQTAFREIFKAFFGNNEKNIKDDIDDINKLPTEKIINGSNFLTKGDKEKLLETLKDVDYNAYKTYDKPREKKNKKLKGKGNPSINGVNVKNNKYEEKEKNLKRSMEKQDQERELE